LITSAAAVGAIAAGLAVFEVALIPGMLIGGVAVLAPRYLPKAVPKLRRGLRRGLRPLFDPAPREQDEAVMAAADQREGGSAAPAPTLGIKRAVAKTITFRIIVTTLDFTSNYVVIGEFATAAGLSAFALVTGPLLYLAHETAWNYFGPSGLSVPVRLPVRATARMGDGGGFTISRALAKTITFRTIASVVDFTTTYVVVGDLAVAAGLSAFAFVVGPFVYLGHEMVWDYYSAPTGRKADRPMLLLPAPSR